MADEVEPKPMPLAQFVEALRHQLRQAQEEANSQMPIELGKVSVEFTVLSHREAEGKAGVKFWVVDAGASGKLSHESTQKVIMELFPMDSTGTRPARVHDHEQVLRQSPEVADRQSHSRSGEDW